MTSTARRDRATTAPYTASAAVQILLDAARAYEDASRELWAVCAQLRKISKEARR